MAAGYYDDNHFDDDDSVRFEEPSVPTKWRCNACGCLRDRSLCHRVEYMECDGTWFETVCEDCIDR